MTTRILIALGVTLVLTRPTMAQIAAAKEQLPAPDAPTPVAPLFNELPTSPSGPARAWVSADALAAWITGRTSPALVTTSPAGTARPVAGVLGQPNTTTLFGGSAFNDDIRPGVRLGLGYWWGDQRRFGVEAGLTVLESQLSLFSASSTGTAIIARPYTDANTFTQQAVLVAFPGLSNGSIGVQVGSSNFYGANLDFAAKLVDGNGMFRLDALAGYRFYRFDESLRVQQNMTPTDPIFIPGTTIQAADDFGVTNEFHGGSIGIRPRFVRQSLTVDLLAKVAIGNMHQSVNILGAQVITVPGMAPVQQPGGVFALATNNGTYGRNELAVLPEFAASAGWRITPNINIRLGYSILLLNQVARAADQVNTTINPNRFPGANAPAGGINEPAFYLNRTNAWLHGGFAGIEFSY